MHTRVIRKIVAKKDNHRLKLNISVRSNFLVSVHILIFIKKANLYTDEKMWTLISALRESCSYFLVGVHIFVLMKIKMWTPTRKSELTQMVIISTLGTKIGNPTFWMTLDSCWYHGGSPWAVQRARREADATIYLRQVNAH